MYWSTRPGVFLSLICKKMANAFCLPSWNRARSGPGWWPELQLSLWTCPNGVEEHIAPHEHIMSSVLCVATPHTQNVSVIISSSMPCSSCSLSKPSLKHLGTDGKAQSLLSSRATKTQTRHLILINSLGGGRIKNQIIYLESWKSAFVIIILFSKGSRCWV